MTSIRNHEDWFTNHAEKKIRQAGGNAGPLRLKLLHTANVLDNARKIAASENLDPFLRRASELAALYHDLARFEQFLQYGTFKDAESRSHGPWAVALLKRHKRLEDEPLRMQRLVLAAVGLHNRKALPDSLRGDMLAVCQITRDADKIDIARVMDEHLSGEKPYNPTVILGLPDSPDIHSPEVIKTALSGRPASYSDLRSLNDFRLLLGTWLFGLNFQSSKKIFIQEGHALNLLLPVPDDQRYGKARSMLVTMLQKRD